MNKYRRGSSKDLEFFIISKLEGLKLKRPFGSIEKATYEIHTLNQGYWNICLYRFTTTIYTEEEAIELLLEKAKTFKSKITKIVKGKKTVIYQDTLREDNRAKIVEYNGKKMTITELASLLGVERNAFSMHMYRNGYNLNKVMGKIGAVA